MSTTTPKLGLKRPDTTDPFLTSDFQGNYDILDNNPGIFIGTTSGINTHFAGKTAGLYAYNTTTSTLVMWNGTYVVPAKPRGQVAIKTPLASSSSITSTSSGSPTSTSLTATASVTNGSYNPFRYRVEAYIPSTTGTSGGAGTLSLKFLTTNLTLDTHTATLTLPNKDNNSGGGKPGILLLAFGTVASGQTSITATVGGWVSVGSASIDAGATLVITEF